MALEATTLTFVGHSWGAMRAQLGIVIGALQLRLTRSQVWAIVRWAFYSIVFVLLVELPLCLIMSFSGVKSFARYLSGSEKASKIAARMWRTIDWCYILYGVSTQLAAILIATCSK